MQSGDGIRVVHPLFQGEGDGAIPISPLQLEIAEVSVNVAQALNEHWHSVLPVTDKGNLTRNAHAVYYAAFFANRYYAVAIWTTPVNNHQMADAGHVLELRRFAIADDAPKNTASRMLKIMKSLILRKFPEMKRFVSYQHMSHHNGTIYKAAGWQIGRINKAGPKWHERKGRENRLEQTDSATVRWELAL